MINDVQHLPGSLQFVGDKLKTLETKLNLPWYYGLFITPLTGPLEAFAATVSSVYAASIAGGSALAIKLPTWIVPHDWQAEWQKNKVVAKSWHFAVEALKMAGMGTLKAMPIAGYVSTHALYSSIERERAAKAEKKALEEQLKNPSSLHAQIEGLREIVATLQAAKAEADAKLEQTVTSYKTREDLLKEQLQTQTLTLMQDKTKEIQALNKRLEEKERSVEASGSEVSKIRKEIEAKEAALREVTQKLLELQAGAKVVHDDYQKTIASLNEQLSKTQLALSSLTDQSKPTPPPRRGRKRKS